MSGAATSPSAAIYGEAVDLARDFARCWTHDGRLEAVEEFARQLRDELNLALDKHRLARLDRRGVGEPPREGDGPDGFFV